MGNKGESAVGIGSGGSSYSGDSTLTWPVGIGDDITSLHVCAGQCYGISGSAGEFQTYHP